VQTVVAELRTEKLRKALCSRKKELNLGFLSAFRQAKAKEKLFPTK
jgi:hypothetical protein